MDLTAYTPKHRVAFLTDAAWGVELHRQFGVRGACVRYTPEGRGVPGSKLRALYDARMAAQEAWHAEIDATLHTSSRLPPNYFHAGVTTKNG